MLTFLQFINEDFKSSAIIKLPSGVEVNYDKIEERKIVFRPYIKPFLSIGEKLMGVFFSINNNLLNLCWNNGQHHGTTLLELGRQDSKFAIFHKIYDDTCCLGFSTNQVSDWCFTYYMWKNKKFPFTTLFGKSVTMLEKQHNIKKILGITDEDWKSILENATG